MAGSRDTAGDSGNGRNGGLLSSLDVKERLIVALMAVILGGGGAVGTLNIIPNKMLEDRARPDRFTGTMGKEMEARLQAQIIAIEGQVAELQSMVIRLEERAREMVAHHRGLEADLKADAARLQQHLVRGEGGFFKIESHERRIDMLEKRDR